jgi:hypothetical protein
MGQNYTAGYRSIKQDVRRSTTAQDAILLALKLRKQRRASRF